MNITVSGKQVDTGKALRDHVHKQTTEALTKYFERAMDAHVTFSRAGHQFRCDCSAHLETGLVAQASAEEPAVYAAFDAALDRLEKQIRRYKRRLRDHHS